MFTIDFSLSPHFIYNFLIRIHNIYKRRDNEVIYYFLKRNLSQASAVYRSYVVRLSIWFRDEVWERTAPYVNSHGDDGVSPNERYGSVNEIYLINVNKKLSPKKMLSRLNFMLIDAGWYYSRDLFLDRKFVSFLLHY